MLPVAQNMKNSVNKLTMYFRFNLYMCLAAFSHFAAYFLNAVHVLPNALSFLHASVN